MRKQLNPYAAGGVVLAVLVVAAYLVFSRLGTGQQAYGMQGLSPELREAIKKRGPTPMTPMPSIGGAPNGVTAPVGPPAARGSAPARP